jgi:hypothetical protein
MMEMLTKTDRLKMDWLESCVEERDAKIKKLEAKIEELECKLSPYKFTNGNNTNQQKENKW